jgi:hypothetical protein
MKSKLVFVFLYPIMFLLCVAVAAIAFELSKPLWIVAGFLALATSMVVTAGIDIRKYS